MRVIFVNRFYWPEQPATAQLLSDLAEGLAARGWEVAVITSAPRDHVRTETHAGVHIFRLPAAPRAAKDSLGAKAWSFLRFHFGVAAELWRRITPDTVVVALTDPPLLGLTCAAVARIRQAALVHWVHDIYPELAITLTAQHWARGLIPLRNVAWRSADACVTLGNDMADHLRAARVDEVALHVIANWAPRGVAPVQPAAVAARRAEWGLAHSCVIMYAGNLGRVHDLDPLLAVAAHLVQAPEVVFVLLGGGPRKEALQIAAAARGLPNVRFLPAQPREQLALSLSVADLHLVTLLPSCATLVFPSKLYGAAATGRPIVFIGPHDAEPARVIRAAGCGMALASDDPESAAAQLRQLAEDSPRRSALGLAALRFAERTSVTHGVTAWHNCLSAIWRRRSKSSPR